MAYYSKKYPKQKFGVALKKNCVQKKIDVAQKVIWC